MHLLVAHGLTQSCVHARRLRASVCLSSRARPPYETTNVGAFGGLAALNRGTMGVCGVSVGPWVYGSVRSSLLIGTLGTVGPEGIALLVSAGGNDRTQPAIPCASSATHRGDDAVRWSSNQGEHWERSTCRRRAVPGRRASGSPRNWMFAYQRSPLIGGWPPRSATQVATRAVCSMRWILKCPRSWLRSPITFRLTVRSPFW